MASLIPLEEAAKMLGMTVEDLTELRSRGDIHAYRDGKTWKFKEAEIVRYKAMHQADVTDNAPKVGESAVLSGSSLEIDADLDELVDVSEIELDDEGSGEVIDDDDIGLESSSSSTIIGKPKLSEATVGDSEEMIEIGQVDEPAATGDSGPELTVSSGSDLKLVGESGISLDVSEDPGSSDLRLLESGISIDEGVSPGDSEILLEGAADDTDEAAATGELPSIKPDAQVDDMMLEPEIDLESALNLSDEDLELSVGSSSEVSLDGSDLSLAASDTGVTDGSDVTLDASGSGINLGTPSDSGIALDQTPPEIAISGEALELGEADLVDLDEALLEEDEALQADDDFLLSPSESDMGEDDSGSQVIALDTEELDQDAATILGDEQAEFETFEATDEDAELAPIAAAIGAEAPFSIWNVLALGSIVTLLGLTGVMMLDIVRNMWSWQGDYAINSTIMDFLLSMFG